jgi:hypothetical protein
LRAGYLDQASSSEESYIAKHERFGDKLVREVSFQRLQAAVQNSEIFEDIPEEDALEIAE